VRPREPCLPGEAGGVEVCGPAVHRVTDLAPPGACAVGCLNGGADMRAQLWGFNVRKQLRLLVKDHKISQAAVEHGARV
jgi:hypothetical protein